MHGLSEEFLADKPLFEAVADELLAYLAGAELVIHNAPFDIGFLDEELRRCGRTGVADQVARITDSLLMAREMFPGKSNSLDALCKRLEVDNSNRTLHGALLDAGLLAEVYICMTRGQGSLVIDESRAARRLRRHRDHRPVGPSTCRCRRPATRNWRRIARCLPTSTRPVAASCCGRPIWHNPQLFRSNGLQHSGRLAQR